MRERDDALRRLRVVQTREPLLRERHVAIHRVRFRDHDDIVVLFGGRELDAWWRGRRQKSLRQNKAPSQTGDERERRQPQDAAAARAAFRGVGVRALKLVER